MLHFEIEPGSRRDICSVCGGWISLGHARGSDCREEIGQRIYGQAILRDIERLAGRASEQGNAGGPATRIRGRRASH
jgi:hypothetical protein